MGVNIKRIASIFSIVLLTACQPHKQNANEIKVGVMDGPESDVMEAVIPVAKKKFGLDVKLIKFADYVAPNVALEDGSIDINAFQTKPYLDESAKAKGFKFAIVGNTFLYPIGFYSKKIKNISELPDSAKVAIANDPSNEGRALSVLQQAKLIELKAGVGNLGSVADVVKNPKHLKIVTLDAAQLPRSLEDVDLAAVNNNYAVPAGLNVKKDALIVESTDSPYMNIFVSRQDNQKDPKVLQLIESYQSKEIIAKADDVFKGSAIPGFKAN